MTTVSRLALLIALIIPLPVLAQAPAPRSDVEAMSTAGTRSVRVSATTIVPVRAHLRYSTLLILPDSERILEVHSGDKEFWQVSVPQPAEHVASVKPSKAGAATDINLICASGNIYSFLVVDISGQVAAKPDLKVFVEADVSMLEATTVPPKYLPAHEVAAAQDRATAAIADAHASAERSLSDYPTSLQFDYRFDRSRAPFWVEAIWRDATRTFIRTRTGELPTLYELKDGAPSLIQFDVRGPLFVVPKILDAGYLTIGDKRTDFRREGRP